jgi:hypothetical protein
MRAKRTPRLRNRSRLPPARTKLSAMGKRVTATPIAALARVKE